MLSVETKGIYRDQAADLLDLRVIVFEKRDSSLRPSALESGTVTLMRGPAATKQILQRMDFDSRSALEGGSYRIFFLHPNSLDNLFYQVDVHLSGGLDFTKIGTFVKAPKPKELINTQPDLDIPQKPDNVGAIGDPLDPFANVMLATPVVLPQFFDLVDGYYVIKPIPGYKRKADVFVKGESGWEKQKPDAEILPPPIIQIAPVPSGTRSLDLITLVRTVAPAATIPPYGIVSVNSSGLAVPATSTSGTVGTVGVNISNTSYTGGQSVRILLVGRTKVNNGGTPLQPGSVAWVSSTPGVATTTPPGSNVLKLGVAISADEVAISVSDLH
jgi:hypothetical protein